MSKQLDPKHQKAGTGAPCVLHLGPTLDETLVEYSRFHAWVLKWVDRLKALKQRASDLEAANPPVPPPPPTTFTAYWGWFASDPMPALATADNLTYQSSATFSPGAGLVEVDFHLVPEAHWVVVKEPQSEPVKSRWLDTGSVFNAGFIPDNVFLPAFVTGTYRYYVSRVPASFDPNPASRVQFVV